MSGKKTAIVTGASGGIGAGLVDVAAGYEKGDGKGYCRCRSLPGAGRSCERRDTPRGWRRSGSSLVKNNKDSNQTLDFDEVGMPRLLSVNVGLPRDVRWNGKTVRTAVW